MNVRRLILFAVFVVGLSGQLWAQGEPVTRSSTDAGQPNLGIGFLPMWRTSIGYPEGLSGGFGLALGREYTTRHWVRPKIVHGVMLAGDIGVGAATGRIGWSQLERHDAGFEGFSIEALFVYPWMLRWGLDRGDSYVGVGASLYGGGLVSGSLLRNVSSGGYAATVGLGLVWRTD